MRATKAPTLSRPPASSPPARADGREAFVRDYFQRALLPNRLVSRLYERVRSSLPAGEAAELAAIYIARGALMNGPDDYAGFMFSLREALRAKSGELFSLVDSNEEAFRQDPFIYEMSLNLAFTLDLPPERKAGLLGKALATRFTREGGNGVTMMSANITNALILMKNSGVSLAQALPYIREGAARNAGDEIARREFAARVNAYYPGAL